MKNSFEQCKLIIFTCILPTSLPFSWDTFMRGMVSSFYLGVSRSLKRMWLVLVTCVVSFPISFLCSSVERSSLLLFLIATTNSLSTWAIQNWKKGLPLEGTTAISWWEGDLFFCSPVAGVNLFFCSPVGGVRFVFWFEAKGVHLQFF